LSRAVDGDENGIGGFGPDERLGFVVGFSDEAVDGGLKLDNRCEDAAFEALPVSLANKPSTALTQEQEVGVKWKVKRGCRASQAVTFGCLWVA